jgi:hypothetical protein
MPAGCFPIGQYPPGMGVVLEPTTYRGEIVRRLARNFFIARDTPGAILEVGKLAEEIEHRRSPSASEQRRLLPAPRGTKTVW